MIDNKKSLEHDHKKIYDIIFDINPQIRYIGFYHNGYFEGQMREGKKAYLTNEESQKSLEMAVKRWENRKEFSKWVYNLHNHVNEMTGKTFNKSYDETRDLYENFRARCISRNGKSAVEDGCTESLYGIRSKVQLNIVPKIHYSVVKL